MPSPDSLKEPLILRIWSTPAADLFNTLAAEIELQINLLWDGYIPAKKLIREGIEKLDQEAQSWRFEVPMNNLLIT